MIHHYQINLEQIFSEYKFNGKDTTRIITACELYNEVYGKIKRKSQISYWIHIEETIKAYLEDEFRNINGIISILGHDFIEEGLKLGYNYEELCSKLKYGNLEKIEIDCIEKFTMKNEKDDKVRHLEEIILNKKNPNYSILAVGKAYDIYDNSINSLEFLSYKSSKIKEIQAQKIISFLNKNEKVIIKKNNGSKNSVKYLISRLKDALNNLDNYSLFFDSGDLN